MSEIEKDLEAISKHIFKISKKHGIYISAAGSYKSYDGVLTMAPSDDFPITTYTAAYYGFKDEQAKEEIRRIS